MKNKPDLQEQVTSDNQLPPSGGETQAVPPEGSCPDNGSQSQPAELPVRGMRKPLSMGELFALPQEEVQWLVEDLFNLYGSSLLIAKPKKGKSTMVRQLAVAVAQGLPFLGRNCVQGPVLYLALEELDTQVQAHFRLLGGTADDPIYTFTHLRGINPEDLRSYLRETRPSLLIVDTLMTLGASRSGTTTRVAQTRSGHGTRLPARQAATSSWSIMLVRL